MKAGLSSREREILAYVAVHQPVTIREVRDGLAGARPYARSTVQTFLERLRAKGYLDRQAIDDVFCFVTRDRPEALLRRLVEEYVAGTLGGSATPLIAWLREAELTDDQVLALRGIVDSHSTGRQ